MNIHPIHIFLLSLYAFAIVLVIAHATCEWWMPRKWYVKLYGEDRGYHTIRFGDYVRVERTVMQGIYADRGFHNMTVKFSRGAPPEMVLNDPHCNDSRLPQSDTVPDGPLGRPLGIKSNEDGTTTYVSEVHDPDRNWNVDEEMY